MNMLNWDVAVNTGCLTLYNCVRIKADTQHLQWIGSLSADFNLFGYMEQLQSIAFSSMAYKIHICFDAYIAKFLN